MTRVDFYVLEAAGFERHQRTMCRIVGKAWQQGHQIFVRCGSQQDAATFDDLLWRFEDASFIPHTLSETAGDINVCPSIVFSKSRKKTPRGNGPGTAPADVGNIGKRRFKLFMVFVP